MKLTKLKTVIFISLMVMNSNLLPQASQHILDEKNAIIVKGNGKSVKLINNPEALNTTFSELINFLKTDKTDRKIYQGLENQQDAYLCADFAEEVHNNAERAGIRAAWVGITFKNKKERHAVNYFETTDKGPVYVDCTGKGTNTNEQNYINLNPDAVVSTNYDKIAYLKKNAECGYICLNYAESPTYKFYKQYSGKLEKYQKLIDKYNRETEKFNKDIEDKSYYYMNREYEKIVTREKKLKNLYEEIQQMSIEIGDYYIESSGVVKEIKVYW